MLLETQLKGRALVKHYLIRARAKHAETLCTIVALRTGCPARATGAGLRMSSLIIVEEAEFSRA